jgi:hypothetical protein
MDLDIQPNNIHMTLTKSLEDIYFYPIGLCALFCTFSYVKEKMKIKTLTCNIKDESIKYVFASKGYPNRVL